jgi:hypothetical protein
MPEWLGWSVQDGGPLGRPKQKLSVKVKECSQVGRQNKGYSVH